MEATHWQGERLRVARIEAGLSQSRLALRIGAHVTSISDWERGVNQPSARHLVSICDATTKPPGFFFGQDEAAEADIAKALSRAIGDVVRRELERVSA